MSTVRASIDGVCWYGDPFCPCPDGDLCHYEGDEPMTPPTFGETVAMIAGFFAVVSGDRMGVLEGWLLTRPPDMADAFRRWLDRCLRLAGDEKGHYWLYSISEGAELTASVVHMVDSFFPGVRVFGVNVADLRDCGCGAEWSPIPPEVEAAVEDFMVESEGCRVPGAEDPWREAISKMRLASRLAAIRGEEGWTKEIPV